MMSAAAELKIVSILWWRLLLTHAPSGYTPDNMVKTAINALQLQYIINLFHVCCWNTSQTFYYLYNDDALWASNGTSFLKMSGPDTSGSFGLNGIPFTSDAPEEFKHSVTYIINKEKKRQIMMLLLTRTYNPHKTTHKCTALTGIF